MLGLSVKQAVSQTSERIHTTLYDLISAVIDSVEPYNDEISTTVILHLLNSHRVMGTGRFTGYRLLGVETTAGEVTYQLLGKQRTAGEAVC
jgi:hypothetical protein